MTDIDPFSNNYLKTILSALYYLAINLQNDLGIIIHSCTQINVFIMVIIIHLRVFI